jgi:hypothetical protein
MNVSCFFEKNHIFLKKIKKMQKTLYGRWCGGCGADLFPGIVSGGGEETN